MADDAVQPSPELRPLVEAYTTKWGENEEFVKKIVQFCCKKEAECDNLRFDLEDQAESRRRWQKRAVEAEARLSSVQHVMVLVDGNHHFFKPNLVRAGIQGAKSAIDTLVAEAKAFAREQHKNDLPDHLSVVVHIFSDVGTLQSDLLTAGLLADESQLWPFIQAAGRLEPGVTISDCGPGHEAVDAKMKHFYELYLENSQCRHLFLALDPQSEYYKILQAYADDDYTKSKTSLVRSKTSLVRLGEGMANGYNLPFHTVDFSVIRGVPQQATPSTPISPQINGRVSSPSPARQLEDTSAQPLSSHLGNSMPLVQPAPPSPPAAPCSNLEKPSARALQNIQEPLATASQMPTKTPADGNPDDNRLGGSSSVGVVKLDTSSHSSRQSKAAEQSWENAPTNSYAPPPLADPWGEEEPAVQETNSYAPPPLTGPWGEEKPAVQAVDEAPVFWRRSNSDQARRQKPGFWKKDRPFNAQPPRQTPRHFEGSWDDMVQSEQPRAPTRVSTTSPAPTSASFLSSAARSNDLSPTFIRQAVTKPDPDPLARPVCSPIALNQLGQRIDLNLPHETPSEHEDFNVRIKHRPLCNEHHMRNNCCNPRCPFDHEEISDGTYLALRNIARRQPCSEGAECRRHDCYSAHQCPNMSKFSTCAKVKCSFGKKGLHSVVDLEIVEMIQPAEKKTQGEEKPPLEREIDLLEPE